MQTKKFYRDANFRQNSFITRKFLRFLFLYLENFPSLVFYLYLIIPSRDLYAAVSRREVLLTGPINHKALATFGMRKTQEEGRKRREKNTVNK